MTQRTDINPEVRRYHERLGISADYLQTCLLPYCEEPAELVETELDYYGRPQQLIPAARGAWAKMKAAAAADAITIHLISAYRGLQYQFELIQRKLDAGESLEDVLQVNAAPGFSEHHTGRAVDIGTLECPALVTEFEATPAFAWLEQNAQHYGFKLSYPHENPLGISYEPWHWCFHQAL